MSWFRVDDGFSRHPKVLRIPRVRRKSAIGLWTLAGTWISDQLTDGLLPAYMLDELDAAPEEVDDLLTVGLWERDGDDYRMHDYLDYNRSRAEVLAEREAAKQRQRRARERASERRTEHASADVPATSQRASRRDIHSDRHRDTDVTSGDVRAASRSPRPDPTRPDLSVGPSDLPTALPPPAPAKSDARGTRISESWWPSEDMISWCREHAPDVGPTDVEEFRDYWLTVPGQKGRKTSWDLTWKNRARELQSRRGCHPAAQAPVSKTDAALADLAARKAALRQAKVAQQAADDQLALEATR